MTTMTNVDRRLAAAVAAVWQRLSVTTKRWLLPLPRIKVVRQIDSARRLLGRYRQASCRQRECIEIDEIAACAMPAATLQALIGHELGHTLLERTGLASRHIDQERAADRLAERWGCDVDGLYDFTGRERPR